MLLFPRFLCILESTDEPKYSHMGKAALGSPSHAKGVKRDDGESGRGEWFLFFVVNFLAAPLQSKGLHYLERS